MAKKLKEKIKDTAITIGNTAISISIISMFVLAISSVVIYEPKKNLNKSNQNFDYKKCHYNSKDDFNKDPRCLQYYIQQNIISPTTGYMMMNNRK